MKTQVPPADYKTEFVAGSTKAAVTATGAKANDMLMVPIGNLTAPAGFNIRIKDAFYEARVEAIKDSILANGFFKHAALPGYVGKEGDATFIYITGGFTRLEAAKRAIKEGAPLESLPVILKPSGTNMVDLFYGLDIDNTGEPLRPYERAINVKRLVSFGQDEATIAKKLGIGTAYIKDLLAIMAAPQSIQDMVIEGQATVAAAVATIKKHGAKAPDVLKGMLTDAAAATAGKPADGATPAARVTAGRVRASSAPTKAVVPKGHYIAAIKYAIDLPGDSIDWLKRWFNHEPDATDELAATLTKEGKAAQRKAVTARKKAAEKAKKDAEKAAKKKKGKEPDPLIDGEAEDDLI